MRINIIDSINKFIRVSLITIITYLCGMVVLLITFSISMLIALMIYDTFIQIIKYIF